jgi:type IV pilus assembly protein PilA
LKKFEKSVAIRKIHAILKLQTQITKQEEITMKKIQKSKKGFTLVEMVLVIAIIVILAAVLVLGIGTYLNKAKAASSSIKSHNASTNAVVSEINKYT